MAKEVKPAKARTAPTLAAIRTDVAAPDRASAVRGSKSLYPFADLPVGGSFGIIGKEAKSMSSIVSNQNKKPYPVLIGGVPQFHMIGDQVTDKRKMYTKTFYAADVDPKKDPDKATCRIFRMPDEPVKLEDAPAPAAPAAPTPVPPPAS